MSLVTVVIPNYNGIKYLHNCLVSLKKQTYQNLKIIVVDNASTDGSADTIKSEFPDVVLLKRSDNGGFSVAVNEGFKESISLGAKYSILLNNDTTVKEDFAERLVACMEEEKRCFSAQAKLVSMSEPDKMDDGGNFYALTGWAYARGKGKSADKYNRRIKVFSACAGAAIYRLEALEEVGFFDEEHFAYLEDVDIGYRARIYGWQNFYEPSAVVYHAGSGTSGSRYNEFKIRLAARNSVYLIYKNQPLLQWIGHFPWLLTGFIIKQLFFILKGFGGLYHRSVLEGVKLCFSEKGRQNKVKFRWKHLGNYVILEWEMFLNLFRKVLN